MLSKVVILLGLMVWGINANSIDLRYQKTLSSEQKGLNSMILKAGNPEGNNSLRDIAQCTEDFNKSLTSLQDQLSDDLEVCHKDYLDKRSELDEQYKTAQAELIETKTSMCSDFDDCEEKVSVAEFFKCYMDASVENNKVMGQIKEDSQKNYRQCSSEYESIESALNACSEKSQDNFTVGIDEARDTLSDCIIASLQ